MVAAGAVGTAGSFCGLRTKGGGGSCGDSAESCPGTGDEGTGRRGPCPHSS